MSDYSDAIEADQGKHSARTGRKTRKDRLTRHRGRSKPGGMTHPCGCRYVRTGGYWFHVTPCRDHELRDWPVTDEHMIGAAA